MNILKMQQTISDLKNQMKLLGDEDFIKKLSAACRFFYMRESLPNNDMNISLKRGSAKGIITYIAEDFDEPLEDFKEYMK